METQNNNINAGGKCNHSFKWYLTLIITVLLFGIFIGVYIDPQLPAPFSNSKKGYTAGFNAAKKLVEESSFGELFRSPADVRTLTGTVIMVKNNSILVRVASSNPFDDQSLNNRNVLISADTKILSFSMSTSTEAITGDSILPVSSFVPTVVNVFAIKTGDSLIINSLTNIKNLKEFTASEIQIQPVSTK